MCVYVLSPIIYFQSHTHAHIRFFVSFIDATHVVGVRKVVVKCTTGNEIIGACSMHSSSSAFPFERGVPADLRYRYKEYKSTRSFADVVNSVLECSFHRRALFDMHSFRSHRNIKSRPIGNCLTINCFQTDTHASAMRLKAPRLYGRTVFVHLKTTPAKSNYNPGWPAGWPIEVSISAEQQDLG